MKPVSRQELIKRIDGRGGDQPVIDQDKLQVLRVAEESERKRLGVFTLRGGGSLGSDVVINLLSDSFTRLCQIQRGQAAEADRVARHSFSVFGPFETLQGRQAVARLAKALEPPRLKGTI